MKYDWVLFDADQTLFSFYSFDGLKKMLAHFGLDFTLEDYHQYQKINRPLWVEYQNGIISANELKERRLADLSEKTGVGACELNALLMHEMSFLSTPLAGVVEMLESLHKQVKMAIVTNGFMSIQKPRLIHSQTDAFFEFVAVSEALGCAKPHWSIFQKTWEMMGKVDKSRVLMVGDTLESDIIGASQFGFDTCYFNHNNEENTTAIVPTYEIHQMSQLIPVVFGEMEQIK